MSYYAVAMAAVLLLSYFCTTSYELPAGGEVKCFRSAKTA